MLAPPFPSPFPFPRNPLRRRGSIPLTRLLDVLEVRFRRCSGEEVRLEGGVNAVVHDQIAFVVLGGDGRILTVEDLLFPIDLDGLPLLGTGRYRQWRA